MNEKTVKRGKTASLKGAMFVPAATLSLFIMLFLLMAMPATAQSSLCSSLKAELSAIETGRGVAGSARFQQYDRAVRRQQVQIQKTESAARRNRCDLRRSNACDRINASLAAMIGNLEVLQRERDRLAPRGASSRQRETLIRTMRLNGCLDNDEFRQASREPEPSGRRTLLEQIFGTKTYSDRDALGEIDPNLDSRFGTFRTLCVRTCDGYYFPISFSTTKERFQTDLEQCERMCPGAQTELFYHTMPGGDAEQSISYRTGNSYGDLPNAFAYRTNVDSKCTCRGSISVGSFETIAGIEKVEPREPGPADAAPLPLPSFRVDRDLDLDGRQLANGGITVDELRETVSGTGTSSPVATGQGRIRIVGPEFFPVQ